PDPAAEIPEFLCNAPIVRPGPAIEVREVSKRFGSFVAVDHVSLSLPARGIHALIGPNGAGKTTLFNVLTGLFPPDGGAILYAGRDVAGLPADQLARLGLARSFQITNIFKTISVRENLRLAVQARDRRRFSLLRRATAGRAACGECAARRAREVPRPLGAGTCAGRQSLLRRAASAGNRAGARRAPPRSDAGRAAGRTGARGTRAHRRPDATAFRT